MRELKFRAYNKQLKKILFLDPVQWPLQVLLEEEYWIVLQYTGLKDMNGKEIYEGDIVKYTSYSSTTGEKEINVFSVTWNDDVTGFMFCFGGEKREVIGNIYENPELLESK